MHREIKREGEREREKKRKRERAAAVKKMSDNIYFRFRGFYRCLIACELLGNRRKSEGIYIKFFRASPTFKHR